MTGAHSRRKGADAERELAHLLAAEKISAMYRPGPDLEWHGRTVEVKRRAAGAFALFYRWLTDAQLLAVRADRQPWLIVLTLDELLDLIDES